MLTKSEWIKQILFYAIAAVIGWWVFRVTSSYLLAAIMAGSILIDLTVRIFLNGSRCKPNRFSMFLSTDTMPQETTISEICKQVALSALLYVLFAVGCALLLLTVFESPVVPIIMGVMILALLVPRRYISIRQYYHQAEALDGVDRQHLLIFDADMKSVYGSRLLSLVYFVLVMIVALGLAIWFN